MRPTIICLLATSVNVGACAGANTTPAATAAGSTEETQRAAAQPAAARATPTATTGSVDADSAVRPADVRAFTLPAGTHLPIVLETTVGSDVSRVEEPGRARLARAITVQGVTVLPEGSRLSGIVIDAQRPGKVKGRAHVAVRFDTLVPSGEDERYQIDTTAVGRTAPGTKKKDALEIGL